MQLRSYEYPNGFLKVVLRPGDLTEVELRLHVWTSETWAGANATIHNHGWHFVSRVLAGRLMHRCFDLVDDTSQDEYWLHQVTPVRSSDGWAKKTYDVEALGRVGLALDSTTMLDAGALYWLNARVLYEIVPVAPICISSVAQSPFVRAGSFFCSRHEKIESSTLRLRGIEAQRLEKLLQELREKLEAW